MSDPATPIAHPMPVIADVREILGMMFDGLSVKVGPKLDVSPTAHNYFGVYVTDGGVPTALCVCNIPFAAYCGAALSMVPPAVAKQAATDRKLTPVMLANLYEVMNICTRMILNDATAHLKLREMCETANLAPEAAAIAHAPAHRADFEIGIGKYGTGALSVLSR
jgi:hypothetical protein